MDVRCSRCQTEYEFDDDKVRGAGVTVKCSTCGHVFKVAPPQDNMPAPDLADAAEKGVWLVRKHDGTVVRFKELTSLQKWIVEQKVLRTDEISKTGRTWKRLGEIAELASFFQVVDAANVAVAQPTMPSVLERTTLPPTPAAVAEPPPPEQFFGAHPELNVLDDDDPVLQWQRRSRRKKAALFVVVLVLVGVGGLYAAKPELTKSWLQQGLAAVGLDDDKQPSAAEQQQRIEKVLVALHSGRFLPVTKALRDLEATRAQDPLALSLLALLHAELAHIEEGRAFWAQQGAQKTTSVQAAQQSAKRHLAQADEFVGRGRRLAPNDPWAQLASAALHAASKRHPEMSADLEQLAKGAPALVQQEARTMPALAVARLQAHADKLDDKAAHTALQQVQGHEGTLDARLTFAALELQARRQLTQPKVDAKTVDALVADAAPFHLSDEHDVRGALVVDQLKAALGKSTKAAETDAGAPADGETQTPPAADEAKAAAPKTPAKATSSSSASYASLMKKADRARIGDRTKTALKFYKQAHELKNHEGAPLIGMGWAYIDLGRTSQAVSAFKRALVEDPSAVVAQFGLAEAYAIRGENAAAIRAYKKYLKRAPSGPDAADARAALKRLQ